MTRGFLRPRKAVMTLVERRSLFGRALRQELDLTGAHCKGDQIAAMSMTIEDCSTSRQPRPTPDIPSNVLEQFSMKGKVCCVTGASDGIGYAAVEAMAEAGADVALWYNT